MHFMGICFYNFLAEEGGWGGFLYRFGYENVAENTFRPAALLHVFFKQSYNANIVQ